MEIKLLKPKQVDLIFHWPFGKSRALAKQRRLPCIWLPDGSLRFEERAILNLIHPKAADSALKLAQCIYSLSKYSTDEEQEKKQ